MLTWRSGGAFVLAAVLVAAITGEVRAQRVAQESRPVTLTNGAVAGQIGAGVAGTALGFVGAGLLGRAAARAFGHDEESSGRIGLVSAYAGAAAVTAVGPTVIGSRGDVRGSFPAALGGAALGGGVSYALIRLGRAGAFGERGPRAILAGLIIVAAPSIGATVAFNATREGR